MRGFKEFWGYKLHELKGEASSVDWDAIRDDVKRINDILTEYDLNDVYNADETGLFLQSTSNWTLDLDPKTAGTKVSGTRVSLLSSTNATVTDKRKPFILSKNFIAYYCFFSYPKHMYY